MKKYKCPKCKTTAHVVKFGYRKKVHRFFCKKCRKHFSFNPCFIDKKAVLNDHLDGLSFRKLALKYKFSPMKAWRVCQKELLKLPDNNKFTFNYCSRFSNVFVFDGKYFNVSSEERDWVLLWGFDYFRHDIPIFSLAPSENYQAWAKFFAYFRILNHYPKLVVCDDNTNLKLAARSLFPAVKIQTCFNHFKENIRRGLKVRSEDTYKPFVKRIESVLKDKLADQVFDRWLWALYRDYKHDPVCVAVLTNIQKYKTELTGYRNIPRAPVTTNLVEGLNSHLEARLFSLRSFQTIKYARLWINGYILKRRFTKFTDCKGKFKPLNGKRGVDLTKKPGTDLPSFF
jgi:hypothetical protein